MVKRLFLPAIFLLLFLITGGFSQNYLFKVDKNYSVLYINQDGTCTINYEIQFTCDEEAHPIDVVDIGMPNESYVLQSAAAKIDGFTLTDIRKSEYVHPGIEVHLHSHQIAPGETGTLLFSVNTRNMIHPDTKDAAYASIEFSPTWYGSKYTYGETDLVCYFVFPPGVKPDEPRYHRIKFTDAGVDSTGKLWYKFAISNASPSRQYIFGASFPKKYVPAGSIITKPKHRISFGIILAAIFAKLLGSCPCVIVGIFIIFAIIGVVSSAKRKMKYLPPAVSIEGVGIKRGLTAVEAAILLELPLNKVATMILFGLIKKRVVRVKSKEPLVLQIEKTQGESLELHNYEKDFLKTIGKDGKIKQKLLTTTFVNLIKDVQKKTKGFSRTKTRQYYRGILNRAWAEIKEADTPELKSKSLDNNLEWLMMDENYEKKINESFSGTPIIAPIWWGYYTPGFARPAAVTSTGGIGTPHISMPQLPGSTFANSLVTGIQGFSNKIVSNITGFQSAITKVTNPVPVSTSSSWSSSGGSSCACACACAGCACACAGGGR
ncbi:MAG: hypothetical protein B5M53_11660 [Candidatus Cloacimonas sp. 4484_209]|nr:MAG: hypothetical protein B5M53_11660 [Candidatus Cloacimonas sp. 4484_209]